MIVKYTVDMVSKILKIQRFNSFAEKKDQN